MTRRTLAPTDHLFLSLEKRQQPMHVGGLFLFRLPEGAPEDFVYQLAQSMRQSKAKTVSPFNQVLSGLFWREDNEFDIDHHFRHISLPKPGRIRELLTYVSQEHSALIDRAQPLWECHLIEGIEGNRFAAYFKMHHSLIDGIAAMRLLQNSFSTTPDDGQNLPIWSIGYPKRTALKETIKAGSSALSLIQNQLHAMPVVLREVKNSLQEKKTNPDYVSIFQAPKTVFNQRVSASRRFSAQSYSLSRIQKVATTAHCTVNDVILALCSGALRSYLLTHFTLPKRPLIAMVPISLRSEGDDGGNQISMILANLATHKEDRVERLEMIQRSVNNAKKRYARMSKQEILNYSGLIYSMSGLNLLTGILPKLQAFNIVISNVPGPKQELYWHGAPLDALYPVSILLDGQAINITLTSYLDKLECGIIACRKALPKVQSLLTLLEDELIGFEQAYGLETPAVIETTSIDMKHIDV